MAAIYSEIEPFPAQWLRNLANARHITPGTVLEGDFRDFDPRSFDAERCHFFAGLGAWDYALQLAGWPTGAPVWTASLPCQPFSGAGRRRGVDDERHLWPDFRALVQLHRPATIFGEQVAGPDGRKWFGAVRADLEDLGYAVGGADLPACGAGAPQRRPRLWWVAYAHGDQLARLCVHLRQRRPQPEAVELGGAGAFGGSPWADAEWWNCIDGLARPVGRGLRPVADGSSANVAGVHAGGNAIVPHVAAAHIRASMDALLDVAPVTTTSTSATKCA